MPIVRRGKPQMILTSEARNYIRDVGIIAGQREIPEGKGVVMVYRVYFTTRRRDGGNCMKVLKDALFPEDREVFGWELPTGKDKENPRVEVWLFPVDLEPLNVAGLEPLNGIIREISNG